MYKGLKNRQKPTGGVRHPNQKRIETNLRCVTGSPGDEKFVAPKPADVAKNRQNHWKNKDEQSVDR